ncbi:MAG: outer membrane beta-barrel protein [Pseudomonadota bacterium]
MNFRNKTLTFGITIALCLPTMAQSEDFYLTGQIGFSEQSSDSEPYGNNIAVDSDFPGEFDSGDGIVSGIGIGYKFDKQFRIEGRVTYRDSDIEETKFGTGARTGEEYILDGEIESTAFTLEGFYDFTNSTALTPYIKAGIGVSDNSYAARLGGAGVAAFDEFDGNVDGFYDAYSDDDSTEFTWNIGLGASFEVSKSVSLYAEYQYSTFGDVSTGQDSFTDGFRIEDVATNEFALGIKFAL